jgi:hypothetical protein
MPGTHTPAGVAPVLAPSSAAPPRPPAGGPSPGRLLDQLREQVRYRHYSLRTEEATQPT